MIGEEGKEKVGHVGFFWLLIGGEGSLTSYRKWKWVSRHVKNHHSNKPLVRKKSILKFFGVWWGVSVTLRYRHHATNPYIAIGTLNFSHGTPLTTRVQAHASACKLSVGWLKNWFFSDKWLVAMVIFDMTAHPFSLLVWRQWPFSTSQKPEKSNMAAFFCLLHQSWPSINNEIGVAHDELLVYYEYMGEKLIE